MAKITISERVIQQISEKYIKSIRRDAAQIPNIRSVVEEALRHISLDKKINEQDVLGVLQELSDKPIVNDKVIAEAAKKVTAHTATEDLISSVRTYTKQLNKKATEKDIKEIVKTLNPYTSTPFQIKNAVRD